MTATFPISLLGRPAAAGGGGGAGAPEALYEFDPDNDMYKDTARMGGLATLDGDNVGTWVETGGAAADDAKFGVAAMTLRTAGPNGERYVEAPANTGRLLQQDDRAVVSQPHVQFAVARWGSDAGHTHPIFIGGKSGFRGDFGVGSTGDHTAWIGSPGGAGGASFPVNSWQILCLVANSGSTDSRYYRGGTLELGPANLGGDSWKGMVIGNQFTGAGKDETHVAYACFYDSLLTDSDINLKGNELATRFSLTWADI